MGGSVGVLWLIVEIESRGGEMGMKMDVRVCDIKLMVIRVVYDSSDPGAIHRNRLAIWNENYVNRKELKVLRLTLLKGLSNDTPSSVVQSDPNAQ